MTTPLPPQAFQAAIDEQGPDALALICRHGPAAQHDTLWFAPRVPMHACGTTREAQGREWPLYLVPARAAPKALEDSRTHSRDDHPINEPR